MELCEGSVEDHRAAREWIARFMSNVAAALPCPLDRRNKYVVADEHPDSLGHPDCLHLRAAQGWLELGNHLEANEELEHITPQLRSHPEVLEVRWHIHAHAKKWDACVDIAEAIIKLAPEQSDGWIHRSFSLHELKRTQEAFDQLLPMAEKFRGIWTIPYNLSCYCAQLGRLNESENWLKKAMAIDEHIVKRAATDDPDLKPLWDSMSGTLWKRTD